jgi:type IV secretory pathway VirB6-like protein
VVSFSLWADRRYHTLNETQSFPVMPTYNLIVFIFKIYCRQFSSVCGFNKLQQAELSLRNPIEGQLINSCTLRKPKVYLWLRKCPPDVPFPCTVNAVHTLFLASHLCTILSHTVSACFSSDLLSGFPHSLSIHVWHLICRVRSAASSMMDRRTNICLRVSSTHCQTPHYAFRV